MTAKISYVVPQLTTSLFLIVADHPPDEAGPPVLDGVTVTVWHADESPLDTRSVRGYAEWNQPVSRPAAYHIVVSANGRPCDQPRAAQFARAHARAIARTTDAVVIDWMTRDVLVAAAQPERARFYVGNHWLGFDLHVYGDRHDDVPLRQLWSDEPPGVADRCAAQRIRTRGLIRFGLPELVIDDVDCAHRLTALNVLRALAQHLLKGHWDWFTAHELLPGTRTRTLAARQQVPGSAFGAYWSARLTSQPFRVVLTTSDRRLRIAAPDGQPLNDWLASLSSNLRSVAGWPPDDFDNFVALDQPARSS